MHLILLVTCLLGINRTCNLFSPLSLVICDRTELPGDSVVSLLSGTALMALRYLSFDVMTLVHISAALCSDRMCAIIGSSKSLDAEIMCSDLERLVRLSPAKSASTIILKSTAFPLAVTSTKNW